MSILSKNLDQLRVRAPDAARILEKVTGDPDTHIEETPAGYPTARIGRRYLHSRRDPLGEAKRLAAHLDHASCFVVLGIGLAYHVEALMDRFSESDLIRVSKSASRARTALEYRDLTSLLRCGRVHLAVAPDSAELASILRPYEHETIVTVPLVNATTEDDYFASIQRAVDAFIERRTINLNTLRRFGRRWVRNLIANLPEVGRARGVAELTGLLDGIPALVLAAGPSLDELLPYVRELSRRCVVIAVDTALPRLKEVGLQPDIAVIVDPQYWNSRHLDRLRFDRALLVSESSTHPRVFRSFALTPLFSSSLFPLGSYIERSLGDRGRLGAGGSVATSAWDLARLLGCGPIALGGMDLGFPGQRTHCRGSYFEERTHTLSGYLAPAEFSAFAYLRDGQPFLSTANDGGTVITDRRMQLYRWWFESQVVMHPKVVTTNLAAGGVALSGIPYRPAEELFELPPVRHRVDRLLAPFRQRRQTSTTPPAALVACLETLIKSLATIEDSLQGAVSVLGRTSDATRLSTKELELLRNADESILDNPDREIVAFLSLDEAHAVVNQSSETDAANRWSLARELYQSLLDSVIYHRNAIENAVKVYREDNRKTE